MVFAPSRCLWFDGFVRLDHHTPHFATLDLVDAAVLDGYILSVRIAIPIRDFNTLEIRTKSQKQNY